ncbi:flagellar basal body-associated FliL family protein [Maridesulfovibrio sp.]|uniref:flagellar basal body-associated FliL family protein n=1 Tax=Maridesulfovibrio sp. TaxID=2795000 RepID=UPI002A18D6D6|nr:flagellar basal body-associated FliL family protein [Maridesulfovibrio sp.]
MIFLAVSDNDDSGEEITSSAAANKATQKVELDLDDAPFLEDEDEEEEIPEEEPEELPQLEAEPAPKKSKTKLFVLIGIGVIILLLSAILIKLFLFSDATPPPKQETPIEEPLEQTAEEIPAEAPPPPPEEPGVTLLRMEPFWVEQRDKKSNIRFLIARFALTTTDPQVVAEYGRKTLTLRDAVYFYLKNKDLQFLSDKKNVETLKKDLLMVINQYIVAGQFDEILFEQYLVR